MCSLIPRIYLSFVAYCAETSEPERKSLGMRLVLMSMFLLSVMLTTAPEHFSEFVSSHSHTCFKVGLLLHDVFK